MQIVEKTRQRRPVRTRQYVEFKAQFLPKQMDFLQSVADQNYTSVAHALRMAVDYAMIEGQSHD